MYGRRANVNVLAAALAVAVGCVEPGGGGGEASGSTDGGETTDGGADTGATSGEESESGSEETPGGPILAGDPVVSFHQSQPMVVDIGLSFTRPASATLKVVGDPGARSAVLSDPGPALEQTHRLRGLAPATSTGVEVEVEAEDGALESTTVVFTTLAPLQGFRPTFSVTASGDPAPELRIFDFSRYPMPSDQGLFAIEPSGRTRWYVPRETGGGGPAALPAGVKLLSDGKVAFVQDYGLYVLDELGTEVIAYTGEQLGLAGFHHDVVDLPNGNFMVLSYVFQDVYYPAADETRHVAGDLIVEITDAGEVVWEWDSFDYLDPTRIRDSFFESVPIEDPWAGETAYDWTHGNGIVFDPADDSVLVSMRHQDWILKIDHATGDLLWRLGEEGDLALVDGTWFYHQHSPQWQPDGSLLLYDNGIENPNVPDELERSRSVRYEIDEAMGTATQVWEAVSDYRSGIAGDADRLSNGNVLELHSSVPVNPGQALPMFSHMQEIHPESGDEVWGLVGPVGYMVYRCIVDSRLPGETM
jgi:hypothetical protein